MSLPCRASKRQDDLPQGRRAAIRLRRADEWSRQQAAMLSGATTDTDPHHREQCWMYAVDSLLPVRAARSCEEALQCKRG
jgi:hypothetical protein